ncbi:MAG: hypothetical protein Q9166_005983 [cf. Caloplaca sp. 2 TL-2023]
MFENRGLAFDMLESVEEQLCRRARTRRSEARSPEVACLSFGLLTSIMSAPKEGPNPLRPYYIPPSVGDTAGAAPKPSQLSNLGSKYGSSQPSTSPSFGSSARNILADMDYSEYLSDASPSSVATIKTLTEQALWKYSSVFLAQPFEVAKTVLQVRAPAAAQPRRPQRFQAIETRPRGERREDGYQDSEDSSDSDYKPRSYFTDTAPRGYTPPRQSRARRRRGSPDENETEDAASPGSPPAPPRPSPHILDTKSPSSLMAVLSTLWQKEGAWGVFKGTNSTYVHSILVSTITSFARSFFAAIFAVPDPSLSFHINPQAGSVGGLDILSSPAPMASLAIAVSAAAITGIILAPLDIARTKLILTPSTHPPRSVMSTLNTLSSWTLPWSIAPVTFLHSTIPTFMSASLPLFLRSKLSVDPLLTPNVYAIATFIGQALELGVKLPIETVLRRGQMHIAQTSTQVREVQPVLDVGPYRGLIGTMHSIVYEEGERTIKPVPIKGAAPSRIARPVRDPQRRKGQGFEGLWRGWRVSMWGLIGVWGAATLGGVGSSGGEF